MLRWPSQAEVERALRAWTRSEAPRHPDLLRLGYFGSYARGDAGVGSDLDLVAVVSEAREPFTSRSLSWNLTPLPVPAEMLIYTAAEWEDLQARGGRFARTLTEESVWLVP